MSEVHSEESGAAAETLWVSTTKAGFGRCLFFYEASFALRYRSCSAQEDPPLEWVCVCMCVPVCVIGSLIRLLLNQMLQKKKKKSSEKLSNTGGEKKDRSQRTG